MQDNFSLGADDDEDEQNGNDKDQTSVKDNLGNKEDQNEGLDDGEKIDAS